jgi:Flp pilus assembly protein CpaB
MVTTTRPPTATPTDEPGPPHRRVVVRSPGLPGGRAVLGGLLVALAGVGTFVAWRQASGVPDTAYAVAARGLEPGQPVTAADVRLVPVDLPPEVARGAFSSVAEVDGRVALAPVGEGELLQAGALSDRGPAGRAAEVSIALDRALAVDGRLAGGDTVDVYATDQDQTLLVAEGVQVVAVTEGGGFGDGSVLTVTLALPPGTDRVPLVHAARAGEVTLVRTTHLAPGGG